MDPARTVATRARRSPRQLARRHDAGPGRGRVAAAAPGDRRGHRGAAAAGAGGAARHRLPGDGRVRRPRPVRAGGPRVGPRAPAAGRPAVRRAGLRPRDHGAPARPVQRGARRRSTARRRGRRPGAPRPTSTVAAAEHEDDHAWLEASPPVDRRRSDDHAARALPRPEAATRRSRRSSAATARSTCRSSRQTPGLRRTWIWRDGEELDGETTSSSSPGWSSTTARRSTRASRSDAMRAGGRNLREIAPGIVTLLVMEDAPDLLGAGHLPAMRLSRLAAARRPWILAG